MKIENWNGHAIRFIERDGEWWAVLKDVCDALSLTNPTVVASRIDNDMKCKIDPKLNLGSQSNEPIIIINEFGIYQTIFQSRKPEAKEFQRWTFNILKELRRAAGLEGFQIFRMLDKEHQKEAMRKLQQSLKQPVRVDFIKANTIANKAVSTKYGYPKMIKKDAMSPSMLIDREPILDDTVELMGINEKYDLGISVSEQIYKKCI